MNVTHHRYTLPSWHRLVLLGVVLLWSNPVFGQNPDVPVFADDSVFIRQSYYIASPADPLTTAMVLPSMTPEWHSMVTSIPSDLTSLGTAMTGKKNLPLLAGVVLATLGLRAVDKHLWNLTKPNIETYRSPSSFNNYLVEIGDGRTQFGVAGAFATYGLIFDDHRALRTASQSVEAILVTGFVVQVLKRCTGRESPAAADHPDGVWRPFPNLKTYERHQSKYYSFPSGHTATTVALITVISQNYPEWKWFKPVGYVLVGLVEVGLVNSGMHWFSDFPLAMMLGYTCGMIVSERGISRDDGIAIDRTNDITFKPVLTPVGAAVGMSLCF
jgi:membrane-associated phospholipid phosphatase